jgi:hypothetical protein
LRISGTKSSLKLHEPQVLRKIKGQASYYRKKAATRLRRVRFCSPYMQKIKENSRTQRPLPNTRLPSQSKA